MASSEVSGPLSPVGAVSELFRGRLAEPEQRALREEMRQRLHPISCRICRQELAYLRDVGRFPLEERDVQTAYREGRGYRFLLTVWWGRVVDHLAGELREMPAVSSYYRHMSFHLGVRTERDPSLGEEGESAAARSGGFAEAASAPAPVAPAFPVVVSVPVPSAMSGEGSSFSSFPVEPARSPPASSVMRIARTMVELEQLSQRPTPTSGPAAASPAPGLRNGTAPSWLGRAAAASSASGGYAVSTGSPGRSRKKKRETD